MSNLELLVFSSEDCKPCQSYIPIVKEVCNEMTLNLKIIKRENDKDLFEYYQVLSVPVTLLLVDSKAVWSQYGTMSHIKLYNKLKELREKYAY